MSYDPVVHKKVTLKKIQALSTKRSVCEKVIETLDTDGWKDIIEPIIDRAIIDVVGGKIGDTWIGGKLDKAKTDERREYYIGYKQALIDLHGRVKFHVTEYKRLEDELRFLQTTENDNYKMPMEDTRYATT